MDAPSIPRSFLDPWSQTLRDNRDDQLDDFPNYYHVSDPESLSTTSTPHSITLGNGSHIYRKTLLPALRTARHEIVIVTCFWAKSDTLTALHDTLSELAEERRKQIEASLDPGTGGGPEPISVRIGFSSRSLFQKLLHPWSRDGHTYPSSDWGKLGLPPEKVLMAARIDLQVKSLFFLPFSVMHPKFVVVDRKRAFMPSCNVSWETWFEGCVEFTGPAVKQLVRFYQETWERGNYRRQDWGRRGSVMLDAPGVAGGGGNGSGLRVVSNSKPDGRANGHGRLEELSPGSACRKVYLNPPWPVPTVLLPSSHHANPGFRYLPLLARKTAPATPLNAALLTLFENATSNIDIITPNINCRVVIDALLAALARGVNVRVRTSYNMMLIEQLVTALTTTERALKGFIRRYEEMLHGGHSRGTGPDAEAQPPRPGRLEIYYYRPDSQAKERQDAEEPVVSHLKMTLVDGAYLVLGSGNLDRASWYTSQELGLLLYLKGMEFPALWDEVWATRGEARYVPEGVKTGRWAQVAKEGS